MEIFHNFRVMRAMILMLLQYSMVGSVEISEAVNKVPGLRHMGTKTPYIFSTSERKSYLMKKLENEPQDVIKFFIKEEWKNTCKPIHVSVTGRHGNRLPSLKNMKLIQRFTEEVQDVYKLNKVRPETHEVDNKVYKLIKDWKLPYKYSEEKILNDWGYNEIYEIAERFAMNFRDLFIMDDEEPPQIEQAKSKILEDVYVISSDKSRSYNSAKEFLRGLKDILRNPFLTDAKIEYANHLTRFHKACTKFLKIWDAGELGKEVAKYMKTQDIHNMADKVAEKLGLPDILTAPGKVLGKEMAGKMLWTIMNACYGESAYLGELSAWCSLLEEEDFRKLAFSNDLKHYYKNTGYVEETGGEQSCQLLQHIFQYMDKALVGKRLTRPYKKFVFRFGHAETLIPLYSLLGLYREPSPLTANYTLHQDRQFDLSRIAPHSANLQVVLYDCADSDEPLPIKMDKYMVQFFVNEKEEILPMCKYSLCPYSQVRNYYRQHIEFCDINQVCEKNERPPKDEL